MYKRVWDYVPSGHLSNILSHPSPAARPAKQPTVDGRLTVMELWNGDCVEVHAPVPFQSSKMCFKPLWVCAIPANCTRAYEFHVQARTVRSTCHRGRLPFLEWQLHDYPCEHRSTIPKSLVDIAGIAWMKQRAVCCLLHYRIFLIQTEIKQPTSL